MKRAFVFGSVVTMVLAACTGGGAPPTQAPASKPAATASAQASGGASGSAGASAGASGEASGSAGTASGEVTLLVGIAEDPEVEAKAIQMVEEFNSTHPDITVTREALDNDQLRTIIQTRLGSGDVDVFGYDTGPGFGGVLAKAGLLDDMAPAYEQYGWETFDWAKNRCTYSGVISCVPGQVEEVGIYYNKTLFDEHGLKAPTTLDELRTVADALKGADITPLAFGDQDQWPAGHQYSMTLSNLVGRAGLDEKLCGDKPWNDEASVRAIDIYFREFQEAGYFPRDPVAVNYNDANALFYAGKAGMLPTGTWLVPEIDDNTDFEVGFFPFPAIEGDQVAPPAGLGGGTFVAANSDNKEAAYEWIDWTLSDEALNKWFLPVFNQIPAQPVDTSAVEVSPLFQQVLGDLAESAGDANAFGYNIDVLTPAGFNDQMFTGFQEVLNGTLTPQEQADKLQEQYKAGMDAGDTVCPTAT